MVAMLALASGCRLIGTGTLGYAPGGRYGVCAQPAATSGSPVTMRVFGRDPGDTWPPPDTLGVWLHADNFPALVNCGEPSWPHTLLLVRLFAPSEQFDPQNTNAFRSCDELNSRLDSGTGAYVDAGTRYHRYGPISVNPDEPMDALLTIDDIPENREASWVLATKDFGDQLLAKPLRCGTVTAVE